MGSDCGGPGHPESERLFLLLPNPMIGYMNALPAVAVRGTALLVSWPPCELGKSGPVPLLRACRGVIHHHYPPPHTLCLCGLVGGGLYGEGGPCACCGAWQGVAGCAWGRSWPG